MIGSSGTNTALGFASLSANRIVAFNSYTGGNINGVSTLSVYGQTGAASLTANKQLYGIRVDANQALTVLEIQPRIDLLFTDIVMPDMNGRILSDHAREKRPDLKVLYTTGYTRNAIVHNGMLDHDVAFLAKPFTLQQLSLKIREVLDA